MALGSTVLLLVHLEDAPRTHLHLVTLHNLVLTTEGLQPLSLPHLITSVGNAAGRGSWFMAGNGGEMECWMCSLETSGHLLIVYLRACLSDDMTGAVWAGPWFYKGERPLSYCNRACFSASLRRRGGVWELRGPPGGYR